MKSIFVLGATKYSFMIHSFINQEGQYNVLGHAVNEAFIKDVQNECDRRNISLYSLESLFEIVGSKNKVYILNTIGYTNMNRTRQKLSDFCISLGYELINFISNRAIVLSDFNNYGNIVFPGAYVGTDVQIGNNNVFYSGSVMTHDISIGDNNFFAANTTIGGEVHIGNNCFLGMSSTIKNRVVLKDYTLIGAAAYLSHSTKEREVVVPEKSISLNKNSFEISLTPKTKR